jgi:predicted GIY-YIG superfamily endonuclease
MAKKRKPKEKKVHRVYCTYFPNGDYYIGYSGKPQKLYEKYYGSGKAVLQYEGELQKETIAEFEKKSWAKMQEFLLQWQQRKDPNCLNSMMNIRLNKEPLADFEPLEWTPNATSPND